MVRHKRGRRRRSDEEQASDSVAAPVQPLADLQRDAGNSAVSALLQREGDHQGGRGRQQRRDATQQEVEAMDFSDLGDDRRALDHIVDQAAQGDAASAFSRGNDLFSRRQYLDAANAFLESAALYPAASHELLYNACRSFQRAQRNGAHVRPSQATTSRMQTVFADGCRSFDAGDYERAAHAFQVVHRAIPSSRGELAFNLGTCAARLHNWGDAVRHFREAASLGVDGATRELRAARRQLVAQRAEQSTDEVGQIDDVSNEEALNQILNTVQIGEADAAYDNGAREYLHHHFENAADSFRQAIGYAGESPELHWNIAQAEYRARNYEAAVAEYRLAFGQ